MTVTRRSAIKRIASLVIAGPSALAALDEQTRGRSMIGWSRALDNQHYQLVLSQELEDGLSRVLKRQFDSLTTQFIADRDVWYVLGTGAPRD